MGKGFEQAIQPGDLYRNDEGSTYRVLGYQPAPTVILERVLDRHGVPVSEMERDQEHHAVDCLNAKMFTRLVPVD